MFQLLLKYYHQHGHTHVLEGYSIKKNDPQGLIQSFELGNWVQTQRNLYSKQQLSNNRILQLEAIGFVWARNPLKHGTTKFLLPSCP